jgi:hypothetical protein
LSWLPMTPVHAALATIAPAMSPLVQHDERDLDI